MRRILTPARGIFSNHDSTPVWNPLTAAIDARAIASVKFAVWLAGVTQIKVQPGFEFSDDAVTWSGTIIPKPIQTGATFATALEWTYGNFSAFDSVVNVGGTSQAYVRFGLLALNTSAALPMQYAQARLQVESQPVYGSSQECAPARVYTNTDNAFIALTEPLSADDVANVRAELELSGIGSTSMTVQPAWQQSDEPGVDTDWGTANTFGTSRTADGYYAAGAYSAVTPTMRNVRFGVKVTQSSGADVRSCIARARFDWR